MAKFTVERIKRGYEGRSMSEYISISDIQCEEGDEVIVLPSSFEGEPITHFGYGQSFTPAHEEWADWHHPSKGSDWVPDEYSFSYNSLTLPESVKTVVIPASIRDICYCALSHAKHVFVEVSPDNPHYRSENGVLKTK